MRTGLGALVAVRPAAARAVRLVAPEPAGHRRRRRGRTRETEALARAACYDCHSNETEWPVYSYVAPMSWLVRRDVETGRDELNLSELDQDGGHELDDAAETIEEGSMPPRQYVLLHPDARLSDRGGAAPHGRLRAARRWRVRRTAGRG